VVVEVVRVVGLAGNFGVRAWLISVFLRAEPDGKGLAVTSAASSLSETLRPGWWPFVVMGSSRGMRGMNLPCFSFMKFAFLAAMVSIGNILCF
jgi:hypothetical protein